eukprot:1309064-Pleurochrysis_carterae.AAC.1
MTTASGHRCASPTSASMTIPSPRLLPRSTRPISSATQPANSTRTNAASSFLSMVTYPAHLGTKVQEELQRPSYKNGNVPSLPLT